ncbi:MAG: Mth938-like domain-containing protein [Thiobacillus sp.]|nr:Mth938-like domain-containing protein [Thiobacillus sp.]
MKLHLDHNDVQYIITGYGEDHVLVNGVAHNRSLIVLPDEVVTDWAEGLAELTARHFEVVVIRAPEIVLLGTGQRQRFPPPALYRGLIAARIGVEVMDTAAACRTYNILAGEGRRVAAALLIGD